MKRIQSLCGVLFLLPLTAQPAMAQGGCTQDKVVNLVAVQFASGKEKVPQTFTLTSTSNANLKITVNDRGDGFWTCEPCTALVGREQEMKIEFKIPGYSVDPVRGVNRMLGGGCYAVFSFKPGKANWTLEVIPNPGTFPFKFQRSTGGSYELRSPNMPNPKDWRVIKDLSVDDKINLKIYEIRHNKTIYLFDLDDVTSKKIPSLTQDDISERILGERTKYWFGTRQNDDLAPDDPYLEIAKSNRVGAGDISTNFARMLIKAELKGLELKDKLEDNP